MTANFVAITPGTAAATYGAHTLSLNRGQHAKNTGPMLMWSSLRADDEDSTSRFANCFTTWGGGGGRRGEAALRHKDKMKEQDKRNFSGNEAGGRER